MVYPFDRSVPMNASACTPGCERVVPVYLSLKRLRERAEDDQQAADPNDSDAFDEFPPAVRVRWDVAEMGDAPFLVPKSNAGTASAVAARPADPWVCRHRVLHFERVVCSSTQPAHSDTPSPPRSRRRVPCGDAFLVTGVKRFRDGVVVECADTMSDGQEEPDRVGRDSQVEQNAPARDKVYTREVYVMTTATPLRAEGTHCALLADDGGSAGTADDEFSFDGLVIDEAASARVPAAVRTVGERVHTELLGVPKADVVRGMAGEGEEEGATITLRAAKRARTEVGNADDGSSTSSAWGVVVDESELPLSTWLNDVMPLLALSDEAARAEAQADLYCYPDHRRDDEYDSNAEDFSANEYPDDDDDDDGLGADARCRVFRFRRSSVRSTEDEEDETDDACADNRVYGTDVGAYGFFHEEGYREKALGRGWDSEGDEW